MIRNIISKSKILIAKPQSSVINSSYNTNNLIRSFSSININDNVLPSNLEIHDMKVFEKDPQPIIPEQEYWFPTLNVPESIEVISFNNPSDNNIIKSVSLEKKIFEVAIRKDIIHDLIRYIRHKRRQPKKTKRISEIRGSNKKPRPQKGMGLSQAGHRRNSTWVGGAKAHGPVIRDYSISLNRKVRALGMMMTFAAKFREGNLIIVDKLYSENGRTKDLVKLLAEHGLEDAKIMFVDEGLDEGIVRASRNLPTVKAMERRHMNVYEILKRDKLIITEETFMDIQKRLLGQYYYSAKRNKIMNMMKTLEECEKKWTPEVFPRNNNN